jgi:pimeloyl-ACP methyl ester carboxylesterase
LFVWGDQDALGPPSLGEEMCKLMPNARIEVLQDAGHLAWVDQPRRCSELIVNFLVS